MQKCGILLFLPEERSRMRVYLLFCLFFLRGDRIDPMGLERQERAHSEGNRKF